MPANYVLLERIELNATTSSVTFSNIPQTGYTDLKVVVSARDAISASAIDTKVRFNSDAGSNYSFKYILGNGAAASSSGATNTALYTAIIPAATSTASTFGNYELYIPNYTSSAQKSSSADTVSENNGTTAYAKLSAGLWAGTAAINSITFLTDGTGYVAGSTFSLYGIANSSTTPAIAPKADGGNVIGTDGTYWYHIFNTNGTFTPQVGLSCEYLVIAGGGGGGFNVGSGGGAGGYLTGSTSLASSTAVTVTVGAGAAGGTGAGLAPQGSNSVFSSFTAIGGGGGGDVTTGGSGGSGGGGNTTGGTATAGQGNNGGAGIGGSPGFGRPGGGGAGAVGATGQNNAGGDGGVGLSSSFSGSAVFRAGGGGGGLYGGSGATGNGGAGGNGGGGAGSRTSAGSNGTVNTGGGGGGGGNTGSGGQNGGAGGSGIVIVRYLVA